MAGTSHAVAKIAVSAATYWIVRPYDYLVPEEFERDIVTGLHAANVVRSLTNVITA